MKSRRFTHDDDVFVFYYLTTKSLKFEFFPSFIADKGNAQCMDVSGARIYHECKSLLPKAVRLYVWVNDFRGMRMGEFFENLFLKHLS